MDIRITGLSMLIQRMDEVDIKCLCNKYLHIDYQGLQKTAEGNRLTLEHLSTVKQTGKAKSCVFGSVCITELNLGSYQWRNHGETE